MALTMADEETDMIQDGVDINLGAPSCAGDTVLHFAAEKGHVEIMKILLDAGANTAVALRAP